MILNHNNIVTLASMGIVRDNIDTPPESPQIIFQPESDCQVFVPSISKIRRYVVTPTGITYTDTAPDVHALYLNNISHRLYSWNGESMKLLMNTIEGEEQFTDTIDFSQSFMVYHVLTERQLSSSLDIGEGSTVVFHGNGKFIGGSIRGTDIQFIPDGDKVCFSSGCTFDNLNVCASWLRATNFGAVPDMTTSAAHSWTFMGLTCDIQERNGTNNLAVWSMIGSFLSNSTNIKLEFNGEFYSFNPAYDDYSSHNYLKVQHAEDLKLYGGVVVFDLLLQSCTRVNVYQMSFVGHHIVHDFPVICNDKGSYINANPEMANSCYSASTDHLYPCGLAGDGIVASVAPDSIIPSHNIHIEHCHFEMRQSGACGYSKYSNGLVTVESSVFNVIDCSFNHIYFQPIASHCSFTTVERVFSNYCLEGVDISTCANHTTIRCSIFLNCGNGSKQDCILAYRQHSHSNLIENCCFQITDSYHIINIPSRYAFRGNPGADGDTLTLRNCTFNVDSVYSYYAGVICLCNNMLFEKCKFNLNINPANESWKLNSLFGTFGRVPRVGTQMVYIPHVKLIECQIVNNARVSYLASNFAGDYIDFEAQSTYVKSESFTVALKSCHSVQIDSCILEFSTYRFSDFTSTIFMSNSILFNEYQEGCFYLSNLQNINVEVVNNIFKATTKFIRLNSSSQGNITFTGNVINCATLIFKPADLTTVTILESGNVINGNP